MPLNYPVIFVFLVLFLLITQFSRRWQTIQRTFRIPPSNFRVWFFNLTKLRSFKTKYGLKTIFGVLRASFLNVYSVQQYKNLVLFQIVNTKYVARLQTGTVIELVI